MRRLGLLLIVLLVVLSVGAVGQSEAKPDAIQIVVLNGVTGRPLYGILFGPALSLSVFLGKDAVTAPPNSLSYEKHTNWHGTKEVEVGEAKPRVMKVWMDFIKRDCRFKDRYEGLGFSYDGSTLSELPMYSIDTILKKGIVETNFCSSKTRAPTPGVLVMYAMPLSLKELWDE